MTASASAACTPGSNTARDNALIGIGQSGSDCSDNGVTTAISDAISILSIIVGIAAVIMVLVAGFRYITSGGDSARVGAAKNTLIYALIGVAVAALAQVLVHFVINSAADSANTCPYTIKDKNGNVVQGLRIGDAQCKKPN